MSELTVSDIQGLNVRVTRIEKVLTSEGAFAKLDDVEAKLQADHEAKLVEVNKRAADEQAAWDAAGQDERLEIEYRRHVAAREAELETAQAYLADQHAKLQENGDRHLADLTAQIEAAKAEPTVLNTAPVPTNSSPVFSPPTFSPPTFSPQNEPRLGPRIDGRDNHSWPAPGAPEAPLV
jgi:hypothetical protein